MVLSDARGDFQRSALVTVPTLTQTNAANATIFKSLFWAFEELDVEVYRFDERNLKTLFCDCRCDCS